MSLLTTTVLLNDDGHVHTHQRTHIRTAAAIGAGDHHHFILGSQGTHDLLHTRIGSAGRGIGTTQQRDLRRGIGRGRRIDLRIKRTAQHDALRRNLTGLAVADNRARRGRSLHQRVEANIFRVGQPLLFARNRAHTDAFLNRMAAGFNDALFQRPMLGTRILEVEISIFRPAGKAFAQDLLEVMLIQAGGIEKQLARGLKGFRHGNRNISFQHK